MFVAVILGGGAGSRLYPLTKSRAKPAVSIGGAYRLVDIPISNCINSGVNKIYVLTQYNSTSLNRHVGRTYNRGVTFAGKRNAGGWSEMNKKCVTSVMMTGFVEVLAATLSPTNPQEWFQGTADAVRRYSWILDDVRNRKIQHIVVLSGDHLCDLLSFLKGHTFQCVVVRYRMDYMKFVLNHVEKNADVTIACIPCDDQRASDFGLMKIDDKGRITDFAEKPKGADLEAMKVDTTVLGLDSVKAAEQPYIASMGVYIFKKDVLLNLLNDLFMDANDFGSEIIPGANNEGYYLSAYLFDGYWEDIGTVRSFFDANLALTEDPSNFEFYDPEYPIYTSPRGLHPSSIQDSKVTKSLVSHGCHIEKSTIHHAVIGLRSIIGAGSDIQDAMVMGADFYEKEEVRQERIEKGEVPMGIGEGTVLRNCIIDKNARVGKNVHITNKDNVEEKICEEEGYIIRSGIVVVLKGAVIPDGTVI